METPSASEIIFVSLNHNITLAGKMWLVVMLLLRFLVLLCAGYPLYQDEQDRFVCNTIQPGCSNVCYDLFAPLSLVRFWLVQLVTLSLPYLLFIVFVVHKASQGMTFEPSVNPGLFCNQQPPLRNTMEVKLAGDGTECGRGRLQLFTGVYVLLLLVRTVLEVGFGAAHYYLFGFQVPRRFLCQQTPCTTQVDCYISRPTEKTAMLTFMLAVGAFSLLLNMADLLCTAKRSVSYKVKRKRRVERMFEEDYLSDAGAIVVPSPTLREQEVGQPTGSFLKRGARKGSAVGALGLLPQGQASLHRSRASLSAPGALVTSSLHEGGHHGAAQAQDEALENGEGSKVALCALEPPGTPRAIRVSKPSRFKPPPPPRRDLTKALGGAAISGATPGSEVATETAACARKVGQYTLMKVTNEGAELQVIDSREGQEKRSEWV